MEQNRPHKRRDAYRVAPHELRLRRHLAPLRPHDDAGQLGAFLGGQRLGGGGNFGGGAGGETRGIHFLKKPKKSPSGQRPWDESALWRCEPPVPGGEFLRVFDPYGRVTRPTITSFVRFKTEYSTPASCGSQQNACPSEGNGIVAIHFITDPALGNSIT